MKKTIIIVAFAFGTAVCHNEITDVPFHLSAGPGEYEDIAIVPSVSKYVYTSVIVYGGVTQNVIWSVWLDAAGFYRYLTSFTSTQGYSWTDKEPFNYGTSSSLPLTKRDWECKKETYYAKSTSTLEWKVSYRVITPAPTPSLALQTFNGTITFYGQFVTGSCQDIITKPGEWSKGLSIGRNSSIKFNYEPTNLIADWCDVTHNH